MSANVTPALERAAEAEWYAVNGPDATPWTEVPQEFRNRLMQRKREGMLAALNREEIARVLHGDDLAHWNATVGWGELDADTRAWYLRNAAAVVAHLTGRQS